jgi:hypothetical protein
MLVFDPNPMNAYTGNDGTKVFPLAKKTTTNDEWQYTEEEWRIICRQNLGLGGIIIL